MGCCGVQHLLQLLGNAHERVNAVPALLVFGLIVFQEVAPRELCGYEARQGQIWNSVRTLALTAGQSSRTTTHNAHNNTMTVFIKDKEEAAALSSPGIRLQPGLFR